jgi:broad specificity phosphatase PhoE
MTKHLLTALALVAALFLLPAIAGADQVIFLARHAERAATANQAAPPAHGMMMADDPPLSNAGEQRAAKLAGMLAGSGIKQIFTTEYKRTRQTAAPLAQKLKLTPVMTAAKDPAPLVAQLRRAQGAVLVIGHADTMPDLIRKLGVAEAVTIGDNDYDDLFVVVRSAAGRATLIRLKY